MRNDTAVFPDRMKIDGGEPAWQMPDTDRPSRKPRAWLLKIYAAFLLIVGLFLETGGAVLAAYGGSLYYVIVGITVSASAVLLWRRRAEGALLYGAMFLATLAWAIWEIGFGGWLLMPRLAGPAVVGLLLFARPIRQPLIWPRRLRSEQFASARWSVPILLGSIVLAVGIGAGLHAAGSPAPADPIYQVGMGPASAVIPAQSPNGRDWPYFGGNPRGTRFSALTQIDRGNVGRLQVAWTFRTGDPVSEVSPLKIGDSLYICTGTNDLIALDAQTGRQRWRFNARANDKVFLRTCRGVAYYKAPQATGECAERIYTGTIDARLIAVSAQSGRPCAGFGAHGQVSLLDGMGPMAGKYYHVTSAPTIVRGLIIVGGWVMDGERLGEPSGVIRAFDAVTGRFAWAFDAGRPDRQTEPPPGERYTPSTPNAWAPMSVDERLGLVYAPTGNTTGSDFFGGERRPFDEKYSSSVIALDVATGKPRWSFQTTHHDLWDWDVPSQPVLVDLRRQGLIRHALIQPTKRGEIFLLDRETGAPLSPVRELPVPQHGAVPDERLSVTQPFSIGLPSFRGADLRERDMWGITPLDQLWCRLQFKTARYDGTATPPGLTPAILYPGNFGAMNWGSVSVDEDRGLMIVNSSNTAYRINLIARAKAVQMGIRERAWGGEMGRFMPQSNTPYAVDNMPFMSPLGLLCQAPPYGKISAVDLNSGRLIWTKPFGSAAGSGPLGIPSRLPLTVGTPNIGGSIVTRSGLAFIAAATDAYLRAFDAGTGELLWKGALPTSAQATPMTYLDRSGRQIVVIAASGSKALGTRSGDQIVAFALPR